MDLELKDRVALVTGGSRGLGRAMAEALAAEGARVVVCARDREALERTADEMAASGGTIHPVAADVTVKSERARLLEAVVKAYGPVDVLVNNVGGNRRGGICDTTDEDWRSVIDLNVMSHVHLARAVVPSMRDRGAGMILFIAFTKRSDLVSLRKNDSGGTFCPGPNHSELSWHVCFLNGSIGLWVYESMSL